jgi:hypothetical protein
VRVYFKRIITDTVNKNIGMPFFTEPNFQVTYRFHSQYFYHREEAVNNAIKIAIKSNSLPDNDNIDEDLLDKYETELSKLTD